MYLSSSQPSEMSFTVRLVILCSECGCVCVSLFVRVGVPESCDDKMILVLTSARWIAWVCVIFSLYGWY